MVDTPTRDRNEVRPMSDSDRQEVHRMNQQGMGVREIARHFNRAPSTISRILRESGGGARARAGGGRQRAGGAARATATRAAEPTRGRAAAPSKARTTGTTGAGATISRQELRSLEQRISRIENSLSRMSSMLQMTTRRGGGTGSQARKSK